MAVCQKGGREDEEELGDSTRTAKGMIGQALRTNDIHFSQSEKMGFLLSSFSRIFKAIQIRVENNCLYIFPPERENK